MFNPTLKQASDAWLTYATPLGFRSMFLSIAVVLSMSARSAAAFSWWPPMLLGIVAICILASAYLERWVFDKDSGLMERNVGLLFWHSSARTPLSDLAQVTLRQPGVAYEQRPRFLRGVSRRRAILAVEDYAGKAYLLDVVTGCTIQEGHQVAVRIAEFCDIPFDDDPPDAGRQPSAKP